jgi:hypothetical protein
VTWTVRGYGEELSIGGDKAECLDFFGMGWGSLRFVRRRLVGPL